MLLKIACPFILGVSYEATIHPVRARARGMQYLLLPYQNTNYKNTNNQIIHLGIDVTYHEIVELSIVSKQLYTFYNFTNNCHCVNSSSFCSHIQMVPLIKWNKRLWCVKFYIFSNCLRELQQLLIISYFLNIFLFMQDLSKTYSDHFKQSNKCIIKVYLREVWYY